MKKQNNSGSNLKIRTFRSPVEWRSWLSKNHLKEAGVWIRLFKKDSGIKSIIHSEALDEALCFGWIDGQGKKYDESSWLLKFTRRRNKSIWSKKNVERVEKLIELGKMESAGLKEIIEARADGRWDKAYDSSANIVFPEDFMKELSRNKKSLRFFESLDRTNKYSIAWRLQTAKKSETRMKRMEQILDMLSRSEKFH